MHLNGIVEAIDDLLGEALEEGVHVGAVLSRSLEEVEAILALELLDLNEITKKFRKKRREQKLSQ